jgi:hypothetical protein
MAQTALKHDEDLHQAFAQEFHTKPGFAMELISNHNASIDPVVTAVARHRRDDTVDGAEVFSEAEKIDLPDGHRILDVAVRGDARRGQYLSYVAEDQNGRAYKGAAPFRGSTLPQVSPAAQSAYDQARASLEGQGALQRLLSDFETKVDEMRKKLTEEFNAKAAKAGEAESAQPVPEKEQRSSGSPGGTEKTDGERAAARRSTSS